MAGSLREARRVITVKPDRPYFEAWLRRASRQFAVSGRLSQTAAMLARESGGTPDEWSIRLRTILDGGEIPSIEMLTRVDSLLAGPSSSRNDDMAQGMLFP